MHPSQWEFNMSPSPTRHGSPRINQMRHKKSLLPCYTTRPAAAAVPSSCVALKSHVQTRPRRRAGRDRGGRPRRRNGGRRHHFCSYAHTMNKHLGQKSRQHLHQLQRSLRHQCGVGAFLPAFPIPAEIRGLSNLSCVI